MRASASARARGCDVLTRHGGTPIDRRRAGGAARVRRSAPVVHRARVAHGDDGFRRGV